MQQSVNSVLDLNSPPRRRIVRYFEVSSIKICNADTTDVVDAVRLITPYAIKSVSYTHLDVYKRQLYLVVWALTNPISGGQRSTPSNNRQITNPAALPPGKTHRLSQLADADILSLIDSFAVLRGFRNLHPSRHRRSDERGAALLEQSDAALGRRRQRIQPGRLRRDVGDDGALLFIWRNKDWQFLDVRP